MARTTIHLFIMSLVVSLLSMLAHTFAQQKNLMGNIEPKRISGGGLGHAMYRISADVEYAKKSTSSPVLIKAKIGDEILLEVAFAYVDRVDSVKGVSLDSSVRADSEYVAIDTLNPIKDTATVGKRFHAVKRGSSRINLTVFPLDGKPLIKLEAIVEVE